MNFKFTIQQYQSKAVESVAGVFDGQPEGTLEEFMVRGELFHSYANRRVLLRDEKLLENIRKIQADNNIYLSEKIVHDGLGACSLDVEMETGTGKTYVYIKTMFELNKRYGWSKFIIVVPSIAIREGVMKSFTNMSEHFMEQYGKKFQPFIYDSNKLEAVMNFSQDSGLQAMIINVQAFNARDKSSRRITQELDNFGSRQPLEVLKETRPIIILDEPQKMGGEATHEALKRFDPLFTLNYSATHKQHHNLVYDLDAVNAYEQKLVKKIQVIGFEAKNLHGTSGYMYLDKIERYPNKGPRARLEFEVRHKNGIKRETKLLKVRDDLFELSNQLAEYQGYIVNEIEPLQGFVTFSNGIAINVGDLVGDSSEQVVRRAQIRKTISLHFEKEKTLFHQGVKCLSLFFIDKVSHYRKYDSEGREINSEYGEIFEEEYNALLNEYTTGDSDYARYLRNIDVSKTHTGYFSIDKHGHKVDSSLKRNSDISDDISAYDLILKDKERLLSFENPVRFIFSHSALREGWDNPNVFQICTLKHGGTSTIQKRQEVGRGLRLCVNQNGDRMDSDMLGSQVQKVNLLSVIASDGYKNFVTDLQREIEESLYSRPKTATPEYFTGKMINGVKLTKEQALAIYKYLAKNDYVDDKDFITEKYRQDLAQNTLAELPENLQSFRDGIHELIRGIFDPKILDEIVEDGRGPVEHGNPFNDNFNKAEFQRLWSIINHKYSYTVDFDGDELITKSATYTDSNMHVMKLTYIITTSEQAEDNMLDFQVMGNETIITGRKEASVAKYDLCGKVAKATKLTRRTIRKILDKLDVKTFTMFNDNPEEFRDNIIDFINEQRATIVIDHITYDMLEGKYDSDIFTPDKDIDLKRAHKSKKGIQNYVEIDGYARDGKSVERRMAEQLDTAEEVCVYTKLPRGFYIPTPMGNYTPDWAIAFYEGKVKHIFFVAETKGTMDTLQFKAIERAKIECTKKLFASLLAREDIVYHEVDSYESLRNIILN